MRNQIVSMLGEVWGKSIGKPRCQHCKYGVQKSDESFDMDDCCARFSIECPEVRDAMDDTIHWMEVCLTEIELVKREDDNGN